MPATTPSFWHHAVVFASKALHVTFRLANRVETAPVSGTTLYQYDAVGNTTAITQADVSTGAPIQVETRQYDAQNRVITDTVSGPGGPSLTTATRYDHDGNVVQTQQPSGDVVYDSYDLADQLISEEIDAAPVSGPGSPGAVTYTTYRYDSAGNVAQSVDADGRTRTSTYDGDNRALQTIDVTTAPTGTTTITTTAGFDPDGNTVWQTTQTSDTTAPEVVQTHTSSAAYNAADWRTSSTDDGLVTSDGYDAAGQQRTQTIIDGTTPVTTTLDAEGRATAISEGAGGAGPYTSAFGYNLNDLPLSLTLPNGVGETAQYDANSRLTTLQALGPTGVLTPLNSLYSYGYNAADWTTQIISTVNGVGGSEVITHDAQGRVVADQRPGTTGTETWSYDGNGNLLTNGERGATTVYTYTASQPNELLQQHTDGHGVEYVQYDQNGDTTSITSTDSQTQPVTSTYVISDHLFYDAQARPITLTLKDATVTMGYNAQGQRSSYSVTSLGQSQPSLTLQFQYRGDQVGQVVVSGTQRYTDTYLYQQDGTPLEVLRQQGGTTSRYWYVLDGLGSVVALTDASGSVVDRYSYDLWGEPETVSETVPQQLRYNGYWYDAKLGWYWVSVRSYDPEGRWLQPDPSETDGVRTYVYVGDDPADVSDPSGFGGIVPPTCQSYPTLPSCPGHKRTRGGGGGGFLAFLHRVYDFVIGGDLNTLRDEHASGIDKFLAIVDLGSNILTIIPIAGEGVEAAKQAIKGATQVGRKVVAGELGFHDAEQLAKALASRGVKTVAEACAKCFPAGTLVATPHGEQAIQTLQVGEPVLAADPQTGSVEAEPVQAVMQDPISALLAVDLSDGSAITVTADHPFWVDAGTRLTRPGWLAAGQLRIGDALRTARGHDVTVVGVQRNVGRAVVYTLTVAHDHTFFVGRAQVLVHNADSCPNIVLMAAKAAELDRGGILTKAGRALAKHGARPNSAFLSTLGRVHLRSIRRHARS